jgi:beta-lactamase class D
MFKPYFEKLGYPRSKIILQGVVLTTSLLGSSLVFAADTHCFVLSDLKSEKALEKEGNCDLPSTPASSFKIPLAVIGFDSQIFHDATKPAWKYRPEFEETREACQGVQTPASWLKNSCVWYSQELTRKLGMEKFKNYIQQFQYGNQDLTGDPGKNNGLTHSWLQSSLTISPLQQIQFLKKLVQNHLPVSKKAQVLARESLLVEELPGGWKLFGKTGTGVQVNPDGTPSDRHIGWFVGWIENGRTVRVFAYRSFDSKKEETPGGRRAKEKLKLELKARGYLTSIDSK